MAKRNPLGHREYTLSRPMETTSAVEVYTGEPDRGHHHQRRISAVNNPSSPPNLGFTAVDEYLVKYQDPKQADTILKVQQELDETKIVVHKTIESVLERGEELDSLVDCSNALSSQSKTPQRPRAASWPWRVYTLMAKVVSLGR
ncbi:palmitoyltransferase [Puccinia graminis f. sp. tritici]|uniref:Palmitoyltransferase n=1 Tax=Puccinia graminis f. sp. tritici TaxID=56615 RepID=A0A5B0SFW4_PUCGR|nr:palmitoyltransferase [Puccinia graminis f. sp. tritici]